MIKYYKPSELMKVVETINKSTPGKDVFNDPKYQYLQDKWCAAFFGIGYENFVKPCNIGIYEPSFQGDTDFFLKVARIEYPFQTTEAQKKGRKRGLEYKKKEPGTSETFIYDPNESIEGLQQIKNAIKIKADKKYADSKKLSLLVYANIYAPDIEYSDIIKEAEEFKDLFYSIWIITTSKICSLFSKPEIGEISGLQKIEY